MTNQTKEGVLTKTPIGGGSFDDKTSVGAKQGYGEMLTRARKQKVMSLDDAASELNILKRHVEAIEAEDYDALPQYAFARGFVGNYARLLGLDSDELVRQFEAGYPSTLRADKVEHIKAPVQPMGTLSRGKTQMKVNFGLILGVLAVIIFGVLILKMINSAKTTQTQTQNTQTVLTNEATLSASEQAQGAAVGNAGSAIGTGSALNTSSANSEPTAIVNSGTTSAVLDFWVKSTTEIKVTDSSGNELMSGSQSRGSYQVTGTTPLTIVIAKPEQVDLNINKEPIRLAEHTTGDTATLTVR